MINFFLPKFSDFFSANTAITTRYKRDIMQKV